ncbi:Histidine--tRNA ligase [Acaryochloris thomasi RCC1774]|uniref:Histidine--tRNA ligase n=1 Tax=Acaryochloris thomasi RCC1774 TaxID=1764569 RepID=A0A2W1JUR1_9CYAN|nr:ATP phosphoribosyltransferase regulatory subunit [Acaryochloris thomasi]PZD72541.1 Histidine--tRNA ligase [Acaryochloris thomasi RCC1774]
METNRIQPVRGMSDVLPDTCAAYRAVETELHQCFEQFGYRPINVPLVEHTELYLRKSGEAIVTRMYDFVYQNRRLCLRPEMTASIIRAYVEHLEEQTPLPVRLYYGGSVFRYERPQRERYRQFSQVGVELLGSAGPMADAEVIWTACRGLNQLGLKNYRVVIGHIGVLSKFLEGLQLGSRLQNLLLASTDLLRSENGRQKVAQTLQEIYPDYRPTDGSSTATPEQEGQLDKLVTLFQHLNDADAKAAILELLGSLNVDLKGSRSPEEIASRLLEKIHRQNRIPLIDKALEFMTELSALEGEPFEVLEKGKELLPRYGIDTAPLEELRSIVEVLKLYDLDWSQVSLDLGLSRGLQYYTGTIFEIHHASLGGERQICGGGRYDELVTTLGGNRSTPATGFSFGLERVCVALESEGHFNVGSHLRFDAFVIVLDAAQHGYAISVAEQLRNQGLKIELAIRDRTVSKNFQYAEKQSFPFVIVVGADEQAQSAVTLRTKAEQEGQRFTVDEAAQQILRFRTEAVL